MKAMAIALMILAALASRNASCAASAEDGYLAARDRYIKTFEKSGLNDDKALEAHGRALADLEARLRQVVGPNDIKGFGTASKGNLDTLASDDQGFGMLDALVYATADDTARVFVTTPGLLGRWLRGHAHWWDKNNVPQNVAAALKSESFYTQAISADAAVSTFGDIPVTRPADASTVVAMLTVGAQDIGSKAPDTLMIALVRPAKVFLVSAKIEPKIGPIAACEQAWQQFKKQADDAMAGYAKTNDQKLFDKGTRAEEDWDRAYRQCFGARAPKEGFFPAVVKQAQALIDALPAK
jgi:hypothetical protein